MTSELLLDAEACRGGEPCLCTFTERVRVPGGYAGQVGAFVLWKGDTRLDVCTTCGRLHEHDARVTAMPERVEVTYRTDWGAYPYGMNALDPFDNRGLKVEVVVEWPDR